MAAAMLSVLALVFACIPGPSVARAWRTEVTTSDAERQDLGTSLSEGAFEESEDPDSDDDELDTDDGILVSDGASAQRAHRDAIQTPPVGAPSAPTNRAQAAPPTPPPER